ncbi:DUF63 family protein [Halobacterium jilantaiense]|uniref:Uncharacterized membrane protein n=1 Tax=Halobacterium jilantaiense TaxID=355548 RepID=A0A1I0QHM8_9EURY|nr:DUF63 family protein [Halobacterium jilantaiense]SEW26590.1 Uncharacterized membrane protein [Halobacterium jilantaiense]
MNAVALSGVLPSGFALPSLPYLVAVAAATLAVVAGLRRDRPAVSTRVVLALAPWMVLGSSLYVCYQLALFPDAVAPFFGSPVVYVTTFAVAGATWLVARRAGPSVPVVPALAAAGSLLAVPTVGAALYRGWTEQTLTLPWPLAAVAAAAVLTAATWAVVARVRPDDAATVGAAGVLAVFGHALDATSTTVGIDVLGYGEQTPLSAAIIEFAADLPTEPLLGTGWLFVLVKLALAAGVVALLADYVRELPSEGNLLLGVVAAVGLGPGVHNVVLFIAANPAGF